MRVHQRYGTNLPIDPTDFPAVRKACLEKDINMVVVGPEEPLVKGIVDYFLADETISVIFLLSVLPLQRPDWKEAKPSPNNL